MLQKQDIDVVKDTVEALPVGVWRFEGHIGERIDRVALARLTTQEAWDSLYHQTENAFRAREDDRSHRPKGVWRGEFWGKYILGVIGACRYYDDSAVRERIRNGVDGLLSTQDPDGYIGTYRDTRYYGPNTWNIWCRKYTLWGLLEAWKLLGDDSILEGAVRLTDHLMGELGPDGDDIIRTGQFNGLPSTSILKPVIDLYRATGEARYLSFARYIADQWSRHPDGPPDLFNRGLAGEPIHTWFPNPAGWAKSYEFISCVEGMIELYRVTGKGDYLQSAQNIHRLLIAWERNPVGGVSFNDKFSGARFLANSVTEVCDTVYWNRLSFQLFRLTGDVAYLDEIERGLYNGLLCGVATNGTWALRRFRLSHVHVPAHRHFIEGHQCCVDNAPRGLFQATQSAVLRDDAGVRIGMYEPGRGTVTLPSGTELRLSIRGDFMDSGEVTVEVDPEQPEVFSLSLRMPFWSRSTEVRVGNRPVDAETRDSWLRIEREWRPGESISVRFDLAPRLEHFDPSVFSEDDPVTVWHREMWSRIAFMGDEGEPHATDGIKPLSVEHCLKQAPAAMVFRGPAALARDVRLGDRDVFGALPQAFASTDSIRLEPQTAPGGVRRAYVLRWTGGEPIRLCDFASAGNTWDDRSTFNTWLPLSE